MENAPIIAMTCSQEDKGEGNRSKKREIECGVAVKSKLDEYREISDLTGFDNLKAMILAESVMKKKKKKKDKTKLESVSRETADLTGFENLKAMVEAEASMRGDSRKRKRNKIKTQENDTVNVAEEQVQLGENEGSNTVEEKERNRRKERRIRRKRAKLDEYEKISDLSGFENLKAMIEAEAFMRRKNRKGKTEFCGQEDITVDAEEDKGQLDGNEPLKVVEISKQESSQTEEMDEPWHLVIDPAKENEGAGTVDAVQMIRATGQLGEDEGSNIVDGKEKNGIKERRRRRKRKRKRAKLDKYKKIFDLSGFENLKATIEAEAFMRRESRKGETEFCGQEDVTVDVGEEKGQLDENEALKVVEVSKLESGQTSEMDEPRHLVIDPAKENEGAGTVEAVQMIRATGPDDDKSAWDVSLERSVEDTGKVETTITNGANDGVKCVEVIDLCLPPSENDKLISDVTLGISVEDTVPVRPVARENKRRRRRRRNSVITAKYKVEDAKKENDAKYNVVLRALLRKPRYFDPPHWDLETCSNCGKENHTAASCKVKKQNKPCFLCASFEHSWKNCLQGQDCFIRRGTDHIVNDCPQTDQGNNLVSNICLKCGDSGHDMFSCGGDYLADDLKEIQCYVCKSFGHICCVNSWNIDLKQDSCYNCGQSGHLDSECTNSCEAPDGMKSNVVCHKCGKVGHFARRCGGYFKDRLRISDLLSSANPSQSFQRV